MIVGLGSGTTANAYGRENRGTSRAARGSTRRRRDERGNIPSRRIGGDQPRDLDDVEALDLNLDGADEIDAAVPDDQGPGRGTLREKLVADAARRRARSSRARSLSIAWAERMPIPIEVSPFGIRSTSRITADLGASTSRRVKADGSEFITDGGHRIIDCHFSMIDDPAGIERNLKQIVGVFETGLFLDLCDLIVVGHSDRVERLTKGTPAQSTRGWAGQAAPKTGR